MGVHGAYKTIRQYLKPKSQLRLNIVLADVMFQARTLVLLFPPASALMVLRTRDARGVMTTEGFVLQPHLDRACSSMTIF